MRHPSQEELAALGARLFGEPEPDRIPVMDAGDGFCQVLLRPEQAAKAHDLAGWEAQLRAHSHALVRKCGELEDETARLAREEKRLERRGRLLKWGLIALVLAATFAAGMGVSIGGFARACGLALAGGQ